MAGLFIEMKKSALFFVLFNFDFVTISPKSIYELDLVRAVLFFVKSIRFFIYNFINIKLYMKDELGPANEKTD